MSKRQGIMLARSLTLADLERLPGYVIVQAKLDGDRCRVLPAPEGYRLLSSQGNLKNQAVPNIVKTLEAQATAIYGAATAKWPALDGELYVHGWSKQRISSVTSRTVNRHIDHDAVQFHAFDVINKMVQVARYPELYNFDTKGYVRLVPTFKVPNTFEEVEKAMNYFLAIGYEGVIVRDPYGKYEDCGPGGSRRSPALLKLKPDKIGWACIIGFNEAISIEGEPKGMLGSFECEWRHSEVMRGYGKMITVGAGRLRHDERTAIWQQQPLFDNKWVKFRYLTETDEGNPREPVALSIHDEPGGRNGKDRR